MVAPLVLYLVNTLIVMEDKPQLKLLLGIVMVIGCYYHEDRLPFDQWIILEDGVEVMPRQTADEVANLIYTLSQYSTKKI
jgi:hypothetical protein